MIKIDEFVKSRISDGSVKSRRSPAKPQTGQEGLRILSLTYSTAINDKRESGEIFSSSLDITENAYPENQTLFPRVLCEFLQDGGSALDVTASLLPVLRPAFRFS